MLQTLNALASKISPNPSVTSNQYSSMTNKNNLILNGNFNNKMAAESHRYHYNHNNNTSLSKNKNFINKNNPTESMLITESENDLGFVNYKAVEVTENNNLVIGDYDNNRMTNTIDQPDSDYIKMFVGQIPRNMEEDELRNMFSQFGKIHQINILRDKHTGQSKGCCFLTYYTRKAALDAQNALHNIKTLPGMHHPIQMKPADSENRNERKLFVGMLSKKSNESEIRNLFEPFGIIEECTVLRDNTGLSKGCAFVTYTSKQCAANAIKGMHQSRIMEGCSSPLVVKFADTQKDKDQKKIQQMHSNMWNMAISPQSYLATAALTQQLANNNDSHSCLTPLQLLQQQLQQTSTLSNGHSNLNGSLGSLLLQQTSDLSGLSSLNGSCNLTDISPVTLQNLATLANLSVANSVPPIPVQNLIQLAAIGGNNLSQAALSGLTSSSAGLFSSNPSLSALTSTGINGFSPGNLSLSDLTGSIYQSPNVNHEIAANAAGKQIEGPKGANLFIYHLPQECSDMDLASMFTPFGNVISAKVFIDKHTNLSKCFGFVSYDNIVSAQKAISRMNGFQIGTKRLKVQPKRPKDSTKPY